MKNWLVLICVLFLAACSTGKKLDAGLIKDNIVVGQSTRDDVLQICGEPLGIRNSADNKKEIWHYAYVKKNVTGLGVLTHVIGVGTEVKSHKVVCDFTIQDGIVVDYDMQEGNIKKMNFDL